MGNDSPVAVASVSNPRFQENNEIPLNIMNSSVVSIRGENLDGPNANGSISCSLKRKRPPKIEIPNVLREISADVCSAQGQSDGAVCFTDSGVGVFALKGKKKFMEDAHKIVSSSNGLKRFFGVYDGHGGSKAAEFVSENLHNKIFEMLENASEDKQKEEAVKAGYLKTDEEFLKQGMGSGACCVTALIDGKEMVVSNLGDCRAILCRGGMAEALTTDHRPAQEDERTRIEENGGYVVIHRGTWRVHGTLAVSRSIGDAHLKNWVLAEPDTKLIHLTPDMEYLVLASDGLWEEVGNQEAVDIVMQTCSQRKKRLTISSPEKRGTTSSFPCPSPRPPSESPRVPPLKSRRPFHPIVQQKTSEDENACENGSPPSKSRRISLVKQMKMKSHLPNDENEVLIENSAHGGLLVACKDLVNLAVTRGSLDDITVMIVDLNHFKGQ